MATQLARLREMERNGELEPIPEVCGGSLKVGWSGTGQRYWINSGGIWGVGSLQGFGNRDSLEPKTLEVAVGQLIQQLSQPRDNLVPVALERARLGVEVLVLTREHPLLETE